MSRYYTGGFAITPHDTNEHYCSALWVGGVGDVAVVTANGSAFTLVAVPAGTLIELAVKQVKDTGTDATSIVGLT